MKIAVCFSGQLRTAKYAAPNLQRFFGEHLPNIDIFVHTWNFNHQKSGVMQNWDYELLLDEDVEEFKQIWNPKTMIVDDYHQTVDTLNRTRNIEAVTVDNLAYYGNTVSPRWPPLYYSWYQSILFKRDFELLHNFTYDIVIKLRPDIVFPRHRSLRKEIAAWETDKSLFWTDTKTTSTRIDDVFWYASSSVMDRASCYWLAKLNNPNPDYNHFSYMNEIGVNLGHTGEGYVPLRIHCTHIDPLTEWSKLYIEEMRTFGIGNTTWDGNPVSFDEWLERNRPWLDNYDSE